MNNPGPRTCPMEMSNDTVRRSTVSRGVLGMCRAEMQMVSEEALRSLRIANDALEPLSLEPAKQSGRKSRRKMKRSESSPPMPSAPLEPAETSQASYEEEDASDSSRRNGSSDAISASQGMKEAEERYAFIAEGPGSSSRAANDQPSSQNGSRPGKISNGAPDGEQERANVHVNGGSKEAGSVKEPGSSGTSGSKVALQVTLIRLPHSLKSAKTHISVARRLQ